MSTRQIAAREGVSESYVRHLVPLALPAPSIVESICAGRQGDHAQSSKVRIDWLVAEWIRTAGPANFLSKRAFSASFVFSVGADRR